MGGLERFGGPGNALPRDRQPGRLRIRVLAVTAPAVMAAGVGIWVAAPGLGPAGAGVVRLFGTLSADTSGAFGRILAVFIVVTGFVCEVVAVDAWRFSRGRPRLGSVEGRAATVFAPPPTVGLANSVLLALLPLSAFAAAAALAAHGRTAWFLVFAAAGLAAVRLAVRVPGRRSERLALTPDGVHLRRGREEWLTPWDAITAVLRRPDGMDALWVRGAQEFGIGTARLPLDADQLADLVERYRDQPDRRAEIGTPSSIATVKRFQAD